MIRRPAHRNGTRGASEKRCWEDAETASYAIHIVVLALRNLQIITGLAQAGTSDTTAGVAGLELPQAPHGLR